MKFLTLLDHWKNHPSRRKEWAELLQEPAARDAIAVVREKLFTVQSPPVGGNYDLMDYYGLMGAKQAGYLECLTALLGLADISPMKVPERKPWESPKPETEQPKPTE